MAGKHIDLTADGLEGQWIEVANILLKSPRQFQAVQDLANDTSAGKAFIAATVTAWHIKNPITGEQLPAPDSPDLDLDDLPMIVSVRFQEAVKAQMDSIGPKAISSVNS